MSVDDCEHVAARYVRALAEIVAVLGPEGICGCNFGAGCGLPDEAEEALKIAKDALAGRRSPVDEEITPEMLMLALARAEQGKRLRGGQDE
jgi:hypothetical protein